MFIDNSATPVVCYVARTFQIDLIVEVERGYCVQIYFKELGEDPIPSITSFSIRHRVLTNKSVLYICNDLNYLDLKTSIFNKKNKDSR